MKTAEKINKYITDWRQKGYPDDIPDEVPNQLMKLGIAPSYKAICIALLRNDMNLESLGFSPPKSMWYSAIKRAEIAAREKIDEDLA